MNLLAIESSSKKLTIGLFVSGKISKLSSVKINDTANALPLLVNQIIKENSLKHTDVDLSASVICVLAPHATYRRACSRKPHQSYRCVAKCMAL